MPPSSTLSTTLTQGITLTSSGADTSPFTITPTGAISNPTTQNGVYSTLAGAYLLNQGNIAAAPNTVFSGSEVYFSDGGTIINKGRAGQISGNLHGIKIANAPGTILNTGTIQGEGTAIALYNGGTINNASTNAVIYDHVNRAIFDIEGTVINAGTIAGPNIGIRAADGAISNTGTILGGGAGVFSYVLPGTVLNTGLIAATSDTLFFQSAILSDGIYLAAGGTATNAGTLAGDVYAFRAAGAKYASRLIVDPGAVFIGSISGSAAASASSTIEFAKGHGSLAGFGVSIANFETITFDTGAAWSLSGKTSGFKYASITNFSTLDKLDITNLACTNPENLTVGSNGALIVNEVSTLITLHAAAGEIGAHFTVTSDGATGTLIEATCFCPGTHILTPQGEVAIEVLKIGDEVQTLHAGPQKIKWLGTSRFAAPFCNHAKLLPIRIAANAIGPGLPARDLYVSPGHAIARGGALIHAARLVNGTTITQLRHAETVEYFHIELETHELILAENLPAETFLGECFRNQFHNAAEFRARYPDAQAPQHPCLPPLDSGPRLAALQRKTQAASHPGPVRAFIDLATLTYCAGWAYEATNPSEPVWLDILANGRRIARTLANTPRPDLLAAGYPNGHLGFEASFPETHEPITIRASGRFFEKKLRKKLLKF